MPSNNYLSARVFVRATGDPHQPVTPQLPKQVVLWINNSLFWRLRLGYIMFAIRALKRVNNICANGNHQRLLSILANEKMAANCGVSAFVAEDKYVVIDSVDAKQLKYPQIWLRDNCQCDQCFNRAAKSRILDWSTFDVDVKPVEVAVSKLYFWGEKIVSKSV